MHYSGVTLIELLLTLCVAGLLLALALPGFNRLTATHQGSAAINQMIGAVHYVRNAAVTHRTTVTLCPSASGLNCARRNEWHLGAIAFADANQNGRMDPSDYLLRGFPALPPGHRIYWRSFRNKKYLQINSRGLTNWQNGNLLYCPPDDDVRLARLLIINAQGRVRQGPDVNSDGVVENARGRAVACPGR